MKTTKLEGVRVLVVDDLQHILTTCGRFWSGTAWR